MKRFLVILLLTAAVWLGVSMSEEREYPMQVRVQMTGYDTVRYAVVQADTLLPLKARMSGFHAFVLSSLRGGPSIEVPLREGECSVAVSSLTDRLRASLPGARQMTSPLDSLRIKLSERGSRTYEPRIDAVGFSFADQYGLYGEPEIRPAQVTLYGPEEILATIDEVRAMPAELRNIKGSGSFKLLLEPVWEQYADVHPSCREVELYLPVEPYVEKVYSVPIEVEGVDSTVSLRLYPDHATVRAWVAQRDLQRDPDFRVKVDYSEVLATDGRPNLQMVEFPGYVRPRSLEPNEVQCVIIK